MLGTEEKELLTDSKASLQCTRDPGWDADDVVNVL